jgi:hypothetical protein
VFERIEPTDVDWEVWLNEAENRFDALESRSIESAQRPVGNNVVTIGDEKCADATAIDDGAALPAELVADPVDGNAEKRDPDWDVRTPSPWDEDLRTPSTWEAASEDESRMVGVEDVEAVHGMVGPVGVSADEDVVEDE